MIQALKGTQDILPQEIPLWREIENISRSKFAVYGYEEICTPIIEEQALFARSVGADTDIVQKQMYAFKDQGKRNICLRPEETASVVRAYLEHSLDKSEGFFKLFYTGPMFRSEKPQAGRLRQFHQIGVELIGTQSLYASAEVIMLLDDMLKSYSLSNYTTKINSLGCAKDKDVLKRILQKELKAKVGKLCQDCRRRYKTNIMRVLDCKNPACKEIFGSISLKGFLCKECCDDFTKLKSILNENNIKFEESPFLVRGLDYYTGIVFEAVSSALGAQDAVAAGGRYDNLISDLGGPKIGACGFAVGVERIIEALKASGKELNPQQPIKAFIVTIGQEAYDAGFKLLAKLRAKGISSAIDYQGKSLKAQMRYADKIQAQCVIIIGEDELKDKSAVVKNMKNGEQRKVKLDEVVDSL